MRWRRDQRPARRVPLLAWALLAFLAVVQAALAPTRGPARVREEPLAAPPSRAAVTAATLGDPLVGAKLLNLLLQAHDNQPGRPIPFARLDYAMVVRWLELIIALDPHGPYPLLAASRLYGDVADGVRARMMLEFVHRQFLADPGTRWPSLAHAAHVARHQLADPQLALRYARSLREHAPAASTPSWARQMELLLLSDLNEREQARALLGALLESGALTDPGEVRFLLRRLEENERNASGKASTAVGGG